MKKFIMSLLLSSGVLLAGEVKYVVNDFSKEKKYSEETLLLTEMSVKTSDSTLTKEQIETIIKNFKESLKNEEFDTFETSILNEVYKTTSEGIAKCKDVICIGNIFNQFKDFTIVDIAVRYNTQTKKNTVIPMIIDFSDAKNNSAGFISIEDDKNIDYKKINSELIKKVLGNKYKMKPEWVTKKDGLYIVKGKKVIRMMGVSDDLGDAQMTNMNSGDDARVKLAQFANSITTYSKKDGTEVSEVKAKIKVSGAQIIDMWIGKGNKTYSLLEVDVENLKKSNPDIPVSVFDNLKVIETIE